MKPVMTDQELKDLVASLAVEHQKTEAAQLKTEATMNRLAEGHQKVEEAQQKTEVTMNHLAKAQQDTKQYLKELGKQIGGLGNKFGSFTEGMAFPSMKKILQEQFHMENIAPNISSRKAGNMMELDVLAYANTEVNEVYVVEVKSHLRQEHIAEFLEILKRFPHFFPEIYQGKKLYGILALVSGKEVLKLQARKAGLRLAYIHDDLFELEESPDFQPRAF